MLDTINKILWAIATSIIIISSIRISFYLKFPQFKLIKMIKDLFCDKASFSVLMMSLGGKIGVGSIAGVALAVNLGGLGSIFWIWIISIVVSILAYCEAVLGIKYQEKIDKTYYGGPYYYIKKGLNNKNLSIVYAIIILISYMIGFMAIQTNTVTTLALNYFSVNKILVGIIIILITYFVISDGFKSILNTSSKMVPFMTLLYILLGLYVLILNLNHVFDALIQIIESAFNIKSFFSGFIPTFIIGIQRGIFASEAGIGTTSIVASSIKTNYKKQGNIQMLGVYITNFLICTITSIFIIFYSGGELLKNINGIELVNNSFNYYFGSFGTIILFILICLFSFSTIITGYYYGKSSIKFLTNKKIWDLVLKISMFIILFLGCIISSNIIWKLVDLFVAILIIINIYAILKLLKEID